MSLEQKAKRAIKELLEAIELEKGEYCIQHVKKGKLSRAEQCEFQRIYTTLELFAEENE